MVEKLMCVLAFVVSMYQTLFDTAVIAEREGAFLRRLCRLGLSLLHKRVGKRGMRLSPFRRETNSGLQVSHLLTRTGRSEGGLFGSQHEMSSGLQLVLL